MNFLQDTESSIAKQAKINSDLFLEYVLKDSSGKKVRQSEIHNEIQWHIDECKRQGKNYCGILAPWGHGKTEQAIIGRTLKEVGDDPNVRIAIVTNTDDNSKSRVSSITKYILNDKDYKKLYPDIKPAQNEDWSKHKVIVARDSKSKDGTIEAWGVMSSGTGARYDMMFFDDVIDQRNAISNPAFRPAVKENFKNVWLSRLTPEGFALYIATIWHQDDNTSEILKNSEWSFLVMKISEDYKSIECESCFKGKFTIPVWDYWDESALKKRRKLIGERAFNRGFRQQALSDEDRSFPSSDSIFRKDVGLSFAHNSWPRIVGIDPFGQAVVIHVLALHPNGTRVPIEIRRGKWDPNRTVNEIIDTWITHRPQIIVCENNASQSAIVQWVQSKGYKDLPIVPFTTGSQKADPILGLPGLEVEFANGMWLVPYQNIDETDSENPINIWKSEMRDHPLGQAEDTVMASWFAREGARFYMQTQNQNNDIVTGEEVGMVDQVTIGDYE